MKKISRTHKVIVRFAKSKGYLSPIWLLPNSNSKRVQKAFLDLENFLQDAYIQGEIVDVSLEDIDDFMWHLKKEFAFDGWDGIAPYLLSTSKLKKDLLAELNS